MVAHLLKTSVMPLPARIFIRVAHKNCAELRGKVTYRKFAVRTNSACLLWRETSSRPLAGTSVPTRCSGFVRPRPHIACKFNSFHRLRRSPSIRREACATHKCEKPKPLTSPKPYRVLRALHAHVGTAHFFLYLMRRVPTILRTLCVSEIPVGSRTHTRPSLAPSDKTASFLLLCHFLVNTRK